LDEIDKVTAADVQRVAKEFFTAENRTVAVTYQPATAAGTENGVAQ
jgi:predicted Zn-dependent peptidase